MSLQNNRSQESATGDERYFKEQGLRVAAAAARGATSRIANRAIGEMEVQNANGSGINGLQTVENGT